MAQLPTGTVTFLMTDIEGSSKLWERFPDLMPKSVARHHQIIHQAVERNGGVRPADQGEGDSILAAFTRATDAVACALEMQRSLLSEPWPEGIAFHVRVAIHTGEVELRDADNYATPALNRAARLRAIGHGGQVLLSQATWDLVRERPPADGSFRDLGEHRLKDLAQPERVYQLIHPDIPGEFGPLKSLEQMPNNLPLQLTRFIGRDQEIAEVKKLLEGSRLVTLTGAAGCGKTRLVLQVAAEQLEGFRDGVWFVDLSPLGEAEAVMKTVASVLSIKEQPGRSLLEALSEDLKSKETLLILDNCEHVLAECASLASNLLKFSPFLRILSTSREALAVPGETPWRVPSLGVPDPKSPPSAEALEEFEAAQLFLDRAWAIAPGLVLTDEDSAAITQICHRLDGIPLAIELAAARSEVLTFSQIASKLDDQFRLLTGGSRVALERQQTMRAAVEWSYKLLTDDERVLLRRLSVFAGGFELEAAEEVCGGDPLEPSDVLELLSALVQKSLVIASRKGSKARYRLLESIRQFAREKLAETEEGVPVRTRHRDWFLELADQAHQALFGPQQAEWVERLEEEIDNVRAAIEWSNGLRHFEESLRIAAGLFRFWVLRYPIEGMTILGDGLALGGTEITDRTRAMALTCLSYLNMNFGGRADGRRLAEEALPLANRAGDEQLLVRVLTILGNVQLSEGDHEGARLRFQDALGIAERISDIRGVGALSANLGHIASNEADVGEALRRFEEALRMNRQAGDNFNVGMALMLGGDMKLIRGDFNGARIAFQECLETWRELGTPGAMLPAGGLARLAILQGDYEEARLRVLEMIGIGGENKVDLARHFLEYAEGLLAYLDGDYGLARTRYELSADTARRMGQPEGVSYSLLGAARSAEAHEDPTSARALYEEALAEARERNNLLDVMPNLIGIGNVAGELGDPSAATAALSEALAICLKAGDPSEGASALEGLAAVAARAGELERAAHLWGMAASARGTVGSKPWPHRIPKIEEQIAVVRAGLGPEAFERVWDSGHGLSFEEATKQVLNDSEAEPS